MFEVCVSEVGVSEVGISEVGSCEVGTWEVGAFEVGASKVGSSKPSAFEVGTRFYLIAIYNRPLFLFSFFFSFTDNDKAVNALIILAGFAFQKIGFTYP